MKSNILVVDDEPEVLDLVEYNLQQAGFAVSSAADGAEALRKAKSTRPALIILDIMLPEMDGFEVCKLLRRNPDTASIPVLMLTARAAEIDRVLGLELGADDYLTKPFSPRELILRVKNLLGRGRTADEPDQSLAFGGLVIDPARHLVSWRGERIDLTATEFKLLEVLVKRRGRVQSREMLLRDVWEYDCDMDTRTVDTHVRRLREKLGPAALFLDTVRGVGYRFVEHLPGPSATR